VPGLRADTTYQQMAAAVVVAARALAAAQSGRASGDVPVFILGTDAQYVAAHGDVSLAAGQPGEHAAAHTYTHAHSLTRTRAHSLARATHAADCALATAAFVTMPLSD
jgi:hypothetical protein